MEPWQIILALLIAAGLFVVISRVRKAVPKEPQPVKPKPKATSSRFEVQDDWEAVHDQIVADSQKIWPIVRKMPLFYALSFITVLSIALNFIGAYSLTSSINGLGMGRNVRRRDLVHVHGRRRRCSDPVHGDGQGEGRLVRIPGNRPEHSRNRCNLHLRRPSALRDFRVDQRDGERHQRSKPNRGDSVPVADVAD
jgi:hypothetical protein